MFKSKNVDADESSHEEYERLKSWVTEYFKVIGDEFKKINLSIDEINKTIDEFAQRETAPDKTSIRVINSRLTNLENEVAYIHADLLDCDETEIETDNDDDIVLSNIFDKNTHEHLSKKYTKKSDVAEEMNDFPVKIEWKGIFKSGIEKFLTDDVYLGNVLSLGCVFNDVQELAECNAEIIFNDETESRNVEISETTYFNLTNLIILRNKYYR